MFTIPGCFEFTIPQLMQVVRVRLLLRQGGCQLPFLEIFCGFTAIKKVAPRYFPGWKQLGTSVLVNVCSEKVFQMIDFL